MKIISFQGTHGAYSDLACRKFYKDYKTFPCKTFEDTFNAVIDGRAELAMIPVENSIAGRVADIHSLLEKINLKIVSENYLKVEHHLMSRKTIKIELVKNVYSHIHALSQCKENIKKLNLNPINFIDTAGAAEFIASSDGPNAAIASELSAKIYKLKILKENLEDKENNITRFLVFSKNFSKVGIKNKVITTIIFHTNNIPTALYKALGCFASEKVNLTRLESFFVNKKFEQSSFLVDVESHPEKKSFKNAIKELSNYSTKINILGFYKASSYRSIIN